MLRFAALVLLIPLFDAMILVIVAGEIGAVPTVAIVVLTALVGLIMARFEGRRNLRRIERSLRAGDVPTDRVLDGAFILAAGLLLLTPGLVTDAVGFLFLFGLTRAPIRIALKRWVLVPYLDKRSGGMVTGEVYTVRTGSTRHSESDDPIDVDIEVEDVESDEPEGNA